MIENCVKCEGEMTAGNFVDRSQSHQLIWTESELEKSILVAFKSAGREAFCVQTYRCVNCGFLEFYTTDKIYL